MNRLPASRRLFFLLLAAVFVGGAAFMVARLFLRDPDQALFDAVARRDVAGARRLLDAGANPNQPQSVRLSHETGGGLWRGVLRRCWPSRYDAEGVSFVFPLDAALPIVETRNESNLSFGGTDAKERHALLELLLDHGANPNAHGPLQNPPLYRAVATDDALSVQRLLCHGAKPNVVNNVAAIDFIPGGNDEAARARDAASPMGGGFSPLFLAAERCDLTTVQALLARGADPNIKTDWDMTPLHATASFGYTNLRHAPVVKALLVAGANPLLRTNFYTGEDATPMQVAQKTHGAPGRQSVIARADKKNPGDYAETLRLLRSAEARRK